MTEPSSFGAFQPAHQGAESSAVAPGTAAGAEANAAATAFTVGTGGPSAPMAVYNALDLDDDDDDDDDDLIMSPQKQMPPAPGEISPQQQQQQQPQMVVQQMMQPSVIQGQPQMMQQQVPVGQQQQLPGQTPMVLPTGQQPTTILVQPGGQPQQTQLQHGSSLLGPQHPRGPLSGSNGNKGPPAYNPAAALPPTAGTAADVLKMMQQQQQQQQAGGMGDSRNSASGNSGSRSMGYSYPSMLNHSSARGGGGPAGFGEAVGGTGLGAGRIYCLSPHKKHRIKVDLNECTITEGKKTFMADYSATHPRGGGRSDTRGGGGVTVKKTALPTLCRDLLVESCSYGEGCQYLHLATHTQERIDDIVSSSGISVHRRMDIESVEHLAANPPYPVLPAGSWLHVESSSTHEVKCFASQLIYVTAAANVALEQQQGWGRDFQVPELGSPEANGKQLPQHCREYSNRRICDQAERCPFIHIALVQGETMRLRVKGKQKEKFKAASGDAEGSGGVGEGGEDVGKKEDSDAEPVDAGGEAEGKGDAPEGEDEGEDNAVAGGGAPQRPQLVFIKRAAKERPTGATSLGNSKRSGMGNSGTRLYPGGSVGGSAGMIGDRMMLSGAGPIPGIGGGIVPQQGQQPGGFARGGGPPGFLGNVAVGMSHVPQGQRGVPLAPQSQLMQQQPQMMMLQPGQQVMQVGGQQVIAAAQPGQQPFIQQQVVGQQQPGQQQMMMVANPQQQLQQPQFVAQQQQQPQQMMMQLQAQQQLMAMPQQQQQQLMTAAAPGQLPQQFVQQVVQQQPQQRQSGGPQQPQQQQQVVYVAQGPNGQAQLVQQPGGQQQLVQQPQPQMMVQQQQPQQQMMVQQGQPQQQVVYMQQQPGVPMQQQAFPQ